MPTNAEPNPEDGCPKCGGKLWDNRATKKNPKAPDYKCRDKECDGVIWPPKGAARPAAKAANEKQAFSGGPHLPELDGPQEGDDEPLPFERFDKMAALYTKSYLHAATLCTAQFGKDASDTAVAAMAATVFIQACDAGLHR